MSERLLLLITWHDACSGHTGWKPIKDVEKQQPPVVRSVGWEMRRTKRFVTLTASIVDDECDGDVTIPLGMIIREEILQAGPVKR
jgi:hypothetical protein